MPRPLLCPICKSPAVQELDRTGDATAFDCATHGNFQVADTVFAEGRAKDYAALQKAKQRTKAEEWPVIKSSDF